MENFIRALLVIHIAAGFAAFFCAPVALLTLKGGPTHRRFGKYYLYLMSIVSATAIILAIYRPIVFLALVAVFSFYFAFKGYRILLRKNGPAQPLDWAGAALMVASGIGLVALGVLRPAGFPMPSPTVSIAFGVVAILFGGFDILQFARPIADKNAWWYGHMGGMLGSYIAAVSAFSAVNLKFLPPTIRWLWPSLIGVPVIFIWIAYYQRKFNGKQAAPVATA
ncbi:MAG: hypothetical protein M3P27_05310 [Acidobacteriota bacterium]|nr:hypothetical protein [Acidobacteriota bacterium]